jgi:hypothetical protein
LRVDHDFFFAPAYDFGSTKINPSLSPKIFFVASALKHLWHCGVAASHRAFEQAELTL